ncbi:MAG: heme ABC transporter permease [Pseudomonadota bacterium]
MQITELANPTRFLSISSRLMPFLVVATVVAFAVGLYMAFFVAPPDYQQGETVRIMFIHVPSAWLAMFCYTVMSISALGTLVWKHPLADVSAKAAAPIGAVFTFLALTTGSLWGKPMWGTWWVWDARLTSVLILFLMYLGLIALWQAFDDQVAAGKLAAKVILVGFINIPIIRFSVDWWNTLHQPASVVRLDGPTIHESILWPLLVMALAFSLLFLALHLAAMRTEIMARRVRRLRRLAAASGPAATGMPAHADAATGG